MGDLDISLRSVAALMPEDLAAAAFPGAHVAVRGWRESQVTTMERRMDELLDVVVDGTPVLAHFEWMERWTQDIPTRMYEYHTITMLGQLQQIAARRAEALAKRPPGDRTPIPWEHPLPIESAVAVLSGPTKKPLAAERGFRSSMRGSRFCGVRFRVIAVYQRSVEELLSMPGKLWAVFVPAARDTSTAGVKRAIRTLEQRSRTAMELGDLLATMGLVAESRGTLDAIQEMLMKAMEDKGYTPDTKFGRMFWEKGRNEGRNEGRKEGRKEGLGAVVHQFERKMARALTEKEREVLYARAAERGVEHLGDVVLDLDGPALTAWLVAPAA